MEVTIRHNPSFAIARCGLAGGEQLRAESGAMAAHSSGMALEAKMEGGFMKALKRSALGGESFFMTTYTAPPSGGWIDVAANLPGDIVVAGVVPEQPMVVTRGSWLCSSIGVELDSKWAGFRNIAGGEGMGRIHAAGQGTIVLAAYGAIDTVTLAPGETMTVDSGHAVAWSPSTQMSLRKATGGLVQTMKTGEGFVLDFVGPGWVMTQSRNPSALISWLTTALPFSRA